MPLDSTTRSCAPFAASVSDLDLPALVYDIECDGLSPTRLFCIAIAYLGSDPILYSDDDSDLRPLAEGLARLSTARTLIGHNIATFDNLHVERLHPGTIPADARVLDTLVMARLFCPDFHDQRLVAWGLRVRQSKGNYTGGFAAYSRAMADYCAQDVITTCDLFALLCDTLGWGSAVAEEMALAPILKMQEQNGFTFDVPAARALADTFHTEIGDLTAGLRRRFPVEIKETEFVPRRDNSTRGYKKGVPFIKRESVVFNPASRDQCARRLIGAGWVPTEFTAAGKPALKRATLAAIALPEAQELADCFDTSKKYGQLAKGQFGWLRMAQNGRIHGRVNPNGTVTGRMSHSSPNVAQVAKDPRMRALFTARPGWRLVGVDAAAIEARVLAHFLHPYDAGAYRKLIIDGADVHASNLVAAQPYGLSSREGAKTIFYAILYGAGLEKIFAVLVADALKNDPDSALLLPEARGLPETDRAAIGRGVRDAIIGSIIGLAALIADTKAHAKSHIGDPAGAMRRSLLRRELEIAAWRKKKKAATVRTVDEDGAPIEREDTSVDGDAEWEWEEAEVAYSPEDHGFIRGLDGRCIVTAQPTHRG